MPYQSYYYTPPIPGGYNPYQGYLHQQPYYPALHVPYPCGYHPHQDAHPPPPPPRSTSLRATAADFRYNADALPVCTPQIETCSGRSSTENHLDLSNYQKIVAIEMNNMQIAQKFLDISKKVQEIANLPKECLDKSVLKNLETRSKSCSEEWMRSLEILDDIQLDKTQFLSKSKRKSVVNSAHFYMDQADALIQQIKTLHS